MDFAKFLKTASNVAKFALNTAEKLAREGGENDGSAQNEHTAVREMPKPATEPSAPKLTPKKDPLFAEAELPAGELRRVYEEYGNSEISYETGADFYDFDSGAEPFMCCLYSPEGIDEDNFDINKPAFYLIDCDGIMNNAVNSFLENGVPEGVDSFEPVRSEHLLFRARIDNHFGRAVYFYGFLLADGTPCAFVFEYGKSIEGTEDEKTVAAYFKHAAETFELKKK